MLKRVEILNSSGAQTLVLSVSDRGVSPYQVSSIDGLTPPKRDFNLLDLAFQDGRLVNGSEVQSRNIVIHVEYDFRLGPVEDQRRAVYRAVASPLGVHMNFVYDHGKYRIQGFLETLESDIFSINPRLSMTFVAPYPYFTTVTPQTYSLTTTSPEIVASTLGDAETGYLLKITPASSTSQTYTVSDGISKKLTWVGGVPSGSELWVSTVRDARYIRVATNGTTKNVLDGIRTGDLSLKVGGDYDTVKVSTSTKATLSYTVTVYPKWIGL